MLKMMSCLAVAWLSILLFGGLAMAANGNKPVSTLAINYLHPVLVTEMSRHDTDDPAIWINRKRPAESLILGTDKNRDGALYVYDLNGKILREKVVKHLQRPNNVDVEYGLALAGRAVDIAVVTERLTHKLRIFRLPDMEPVDNGGIEVFAGEPSEDYRSPMGIALYRHPQDGTIYAIVSRKRGPTEGYLWQYRLEDDGQGRVKGVLVRKFGAFSGEKEIESIAVDDAAGYVYYSDENLGIRKYFADPRQGSDELALFGTEGFIDDREGIAIYQRDEHRGYILVSDQQGNCFHIYRREGESGEPHRHRLLKTVHTVTNECDGCEIVSTTLSDKFPHGMFVAMSNNKTFQLYRWEALAGDDLELRVGSK